MSQSPFTPEELDDLVSVFEQACREAEAEDCPKTRDWIASQIFKAALEGERDLEKLKSRVMPIS
jgi:hypothetical protein